MHNEISRYCIFFSANKAFLSCLKICLKSIVHNYWSHPDIIICYTDFSLWDLQNLQKIYDGIIFIKNDLTKYEIWPVMKHLPKEIDPKVFYARFLLWRHKIFDNYEKILHLDADIIVTKPLDELFSIDDFLMIKESYQWEDQIFISIENEALQKKLFDDWIVIKNTAGNAWVFLLPSRYRNENYYNQLMWILHKYNTYIKRADQSIINIRMYLNNLEISSQFEYNFQHRFIVDWNHDKILRNAKIIHFNGIADKFRILCMKFFYNLILKWKHSYPWDYRKFYNDLTK